MRITTIILLLLGHFCFAQNNADILIDSLSITNSEEEKVQLAIKISQTIRETDWKRALHYIEYAETRLKNISSEKFTADTYNKIASIFNDNDALDIALSYYLKTYEYYQSKDVEEKYETEGSLAIIYARLNNKERALYYFNNLLRHYTAQKDKPHIAKAYNNIGKLHYSNQRPDSAMIYFNKSLALSKEVKDPELERVLYNNLGLIKASQKKFDEAMTYFNKSRRLAEKSGNKKDMAWTYNSLSQTYLAKKEPDSAVFYALKASDSLSGHKFTFENLFAQQNLYKAYLETQDYENASHYFQSYDMIRDSLGIEMKALNVQKLNLEQQYKENEELRTLKENRKQFTYLIFGFGLIIILLILAILLTRYRNRLIKAQLEKELFESKKKELDANLELKNKELMTHSMMEIQRTEITEQILDELKQIRLQSPKKESQQAIDTVIKQLKKNNADDEVWKEFELRYGQVYETFYKILEEKHPELTYRDKRLCALLKLNLATKEISRITGQPVKSIENARTRLRKKLNLTNTDQNLTNYLTGLE